MLLALIRHETASGTARSSIKGRLPSWSAPCFIKAQKCPFRKRLMLWPASVPSGPTMLEPGGTDAPSFLKARVCLWNSDEHTVGDLSPHVPGDLHRNKLKKGLSMNGYLILYSTFLYVRSPGTGGLWSPKRSSSLCQRQSCALRKGQASLLQGSPCRGNCACGLLTSWSAPRWRDCITNILVLAVPKVTAVSSPDVAY